MITKTEFCHFFVSIISVSDLFKLFLSSYFKYLLKRASINKYFSFLSSLRSSNLNFCLASQLELVDLPALSILSNWTFSSTNRQISKFWIGLYILNKWLKTYEIELLPCHSPGLRSNIKDILTTFWMLIAPS